MPERMGVSAFVPSSRAGVLRPEPYPRSAVVLPSTDGRSTMSGQHEDRVRERAYQLWEKEGRPEGQHLHHWRRAEEELQGRSPAGGNERASDEVEETEGATRALDMSVAAPTNPD